MDLGLLALYFAYSSKNTIHHIVEYQTIYYVIHHHHQQLSIIFSFGMHLCNIVFTGPFDNSEKAYTGLKNCSYVQSRC